MDIGSNSQEFWFWIKRAPQPYVYHCSYADYPEVAKRGAMPFPVQPEWVVEALGMAEYDPKAKYEVNASKDTYDLVQRTNSPQGRRAGQSDRLPQGAPAGNVAGGGVHPLRAGRQGEASDSICSAVVEDSQAVVAGGKTVVLPTKVRLTCPKEKVELTINLGKTKVNQPFGQTDPNILFTRRSLNNYKSYDLARARRPGRRRSPGRRRGSQPQAASLLMYIPTAFRADDRAALYDLIDRHGFGTLVTARDGPPFATHLPFLLDRARGVLLGHVARANPHWRAWTAAPRRW